MPLRAIGAALLAGFALFLLVVLTQAAIAAPHVAPSAPNTQQSHAFVAATPSVTAQPTRNDLIQPTAAPASTSAVPPASTSLGSNGLTIAVILSCVAGTLGIIIASVALSALVRGGYGPFLRALLPGRRGDARSSSRARLNGHSRSPSPRRPAPTRRR